MTDDRRPLDKVLEVAQQSELMSDGSYMCVCPAHEDANPSLHITEDQSGKLLINCFKGCRLPSICHGWGLTVSELFPDHGRSKLSTTATAKKPKRPLGRKVAEYDYRDADGAVVYQAVRYETDDGKKSFVQRRPNGQGGWIGNMRGVTRVLYKLPELIAADRSLTVYIVEGEKKVDALTAWGLIATCNVGGASTVNGVGKWLSSYNTYFRGRDVVILPDNDPVDPKTGVRPGFDHTRKIIASLAGVANSVRIVELPGLPVKGDIIDWIADGGTRDRFLEIINTPPEIDLTDFSLDESSTLTSNALAQSGSLLDQEEQTDAALTKRFTALYSRELNFVPEWGHFIHWTGRRWRADVVQQEMAFAKRFSEHIWEQCHEYEPDKDDEDQTNPIEFLAKRESSTKFLFDVTKLIKSEMEMITHADRLDSCLGLLNVLNGTIDLSTSAIHPHRREDCITKLCQLDYNPNAQFPMWEQFLYKVMGDDMELVQFLQTWFGYCLTGEVREHKVPIFWGRGGNGKSVLLNTVMRVMGGDYAQVAPQNMLLDRGRDDHPTTLAGMFGKRLVLCSETGDGARLNEALIKQLSGGEPIAARKMRQDFWEYMPSFKLVLLTNHKPTVRGTDPGLWRRLILVPFVVNFWDPDKDETGPEDLRMDKKLEAKLTDEYPGILNWLITGAKNWYENGLEIPLAAKAATTEYRGVEDVLQQFIDDQCLEGVMYKVKASDLYKVYKRWAEQGGEYVRSQTKFGIVMSERFQKINSNGNWYLGIALKNNSEYEFEEK